MEINKQDVVLNIDYDMEKAHFEWAGTPYGAIAVIEFNSTVAYSGDGETTPNESWSDHSGFRFIELDCGYSDDETERECTKCETDQIKSAMLDYLIGRL